ncbi:hypothetical protein CA267_012930 [Alteromonas pelagimontana]|uniref:MFS transporter n=1 Tax=Alteromonas pelagimontana TaxID=1858656 RepID=A0A6M4MFE8_9ALTE|nr:hypothetical protein [Alteromonas pelagimontana]QJR81608.1 hypothetical protein CA267_012930 [Alteromonas pelagimontana]
MRKKSVVSILAGVALFSPAVFAQVGAESDISLSGHFFTSVLAGVVIAIGIQFLLSNLAIAMGITAIGDVRDREGNDHHHSSDSSKHSTPGSTSSKILSGLGIFTTLTMTISLFAATWLALDLADGPSPLNGAVTGMAIWALFFIISLYFDIKLMTSICGSLVSFIQSSITKSGAALSGVFSSSDKADPQKFAKETVKSIHDEIRQEFDLSDIDKKIKEYINKGSSDLTAHDLRKEIEKLIDDIEIEEQYTTDDPDAARKLILEVTSKHSSISDKDKKKISDTLGDVKSAMKKDGSNKEKATAAFDKLSPGSEEDGATYRKKITEYLDSTGRDELSSEQIEQDIEKILSHPSQSKDVISQRIQKLDRSSIKAAIAAHPDMDDNKAEKVLGIVNKVMDKISSTTTDSSANANVSQTPNLPVKRSNAENRVQQWCDRMHRPELKYRDLKSDFMEMLDNPKTAPSILSKRVSRMDEQTVRALLTNNSMVDESDIDEYMAKFNEAKADLLAKLEHYQTEAQKRIDAIKHNAYRQSEAARRTASTAAWWLFVSALCSGVAATVAGALASNLI